MDLPTPSARYLGSQDRASLATFKCSTGVWFEEDVERYVSHRLADAHDRRRAHTDHTIIGLVLPDRGLVAVAAHEQDLTADGDRELTSTRWVLAAVAVGLQGAVLRDVAPYDDDRPVTLGRHLAEVTLSDIVATRRDPVVRAIVARENARSLALCRRVGLARSRPDADPRYVQRLGVIAG